MMRTRSRSAFTLIELLVVVAVLAILLGILLPSLGGARESGRAITCAANIRAVAQGVQNYTVESKGFFPPSYVYGNAATGGRWTPSDQQESNPHPDFGYVHWSYALFGGNEGGVA
ncbi:MAG TPA: type II secretion system protein, partial [Phycisphaerales bacterium]|nr:type II secretion system protein [Phycisphaerales bacterium]